MPTLELRHYFNRAPNPGFANIIHDQKIPNAEIHDMVWFNLNGEILGWGDMTYDDFRRIRDTLPQGEGLIVVHQFSLKSAKWDYEKESVLPNSLLLHSYLIVERDIAYFVYMTLIQKNEAVRSMWELKDTSTSSLQNTTFMLSDEVPNLIQSLRESTPNPTPA